MLADNILKPSIRLALERRAEQLGKAPDELVAEILREAVRRSASRAAVSVTSSQVSVTGPREVSA